MFQENANWYGFAVNAVSNTITRFNFGINLDLAPTATNLGNIGNLDYPDGVFAINDNGFWRVFVTNGNAPGGSLTRLDFGNSLLNNPTGTNLGSLGNKLVTPRDITLLRYCGETIGFVVNGSTNQIVKLNFASLTSTPTATNIGNLGNLDFPHSLSKLFRAGNDIYSFITNVNNNTLTRLKFTGCTSSSLPSSNLQTPAPVSYSAPGTYNINLTVDDGLATQSSFCKKVVVISPPSHYPTQNFLLCPGEAIRVGSQTAGVNYVWNTGATTDSITIITGGTYWVESSRFGCSSRDSFVVTQAGAAALDFTYQQNPCTPGSVQFSSILPPGIPYYWDFGNGITNTTSLNPSVLFSTYGTYTIKLRTNFSGSCKDSIVRSIVIDSLFGASLLNNIDTTICLGDSVRLRMASIGNFCWQSPGIPSNGVSSFVKPAGQTTYKLIGEELGLNLIINGDFSNGNTGFTSEYASASSGVAPDTYFVGTSPAVWNPGFSQCGDHTTSNGNMLMINGGIATSKVWYQTITVAPNTNYSFSGWIQSLTSSNPANLRFAINNVDGGNLIQAPTSACQWQKFTVKWNSGNNTSAAVAIISDNSGSGGNDFALDDLSIATFRIRYDSFTVNVTGLCDTIKISGSEKICSPNEVVNYSIYRPVNCSQSFTVNVDNSFADVISQDATSVKLKYKKDGQTTVYVSFNNACKVVIDSLPVRIRFSPTMINFGPDLLVCRDTSFTLHAGPEFESYLWNDGSTDSVRSVFSTGIFSVRAQNLCGLVLRDTIILTKQGIVPFSALPATVSACLNDSVRVSAAGGALYSWTPVASFAQPASPSTRAVVISNQSLTVAIRDTVCRRDTVIVIPVSVFATNPLVVTKTNDVDCSNDSSSLRALGSSQYTWSSSALAQPATTSHITVRPSRTTTFTVAAVDQNGCKSTDSVTVIFSKTNEQRLFVPNAFTPNGDGLNDVFRPVFTGPYKTFNIRIYNRWGQLLFQSGDPLKGWNGKFNNRDQPKDVYVYYLLADGECNGNFKQKGSFVLIR